MDLLRALATLRRCAAAAAAVMVGVGLAPAPAIAATNPQVVRVSVSATGGDANNSSIESSMSADGRFVAFVSGASNLVPGVPRGVFLRDMVTGITSRVDAAYGGGQPNIPGEHPVASADGRYVAFESRATNLVRRDVNGQQDIFVRDTWTETTTLVSLTSST